MVSLCCLADPVSAAFPVTLTAASGRLLLGFRKWYYNMSGFNKLGKLKEQCVVQTLLCYLFRRYCLPWKYESGKP